MAEDVNDSFISPDGCVVQWGPLMVVPGTGVCTRSEQGPDSFLTLPVFIRVDSGGVVIT